MMVCSDFYDVFFGIVKVGVDSWDGKMNFICIIDFLLGKLEEKFYN